MREILFRGKTKDGEWKEGYFEKSFDVTPAIKYFEGVRYRKYEVLPETVTQYTGYKDYNGKKIFEWDIVRWFPEEEECTQDYIVKFGEHFEQEYGFYLEWITDFKYHVQTPLLHWLKKKRIEVVGNIFDNPELLKRTE